jgi:hypothetical protein
MGRGSRQTIGPITDPLEVHVLFSLTNLLIIGRIRFLLKLNHEVAILGNLRLQLLKKLEFQFRGHLHPLRPTDNLPALRPAQR